MKQKYLSICFLFFLLCSCLIISAQEIAKVRTTKYTINLNKIKHQEQVDAVSTQTKNIVNVVTCKLDWLNYKMEITVKEGGGYGTFSMEKLKAILIENKVDLVKFTKKQIE